MLTNEEILINKINKHELEKNIKEYIENNLIDFSIIAKEKNILNKILYNYKKY